jgi:hypothetical protein
MSDEDFNMVTVSSGNLAEVGFNPDTKQGCIQFLKGARYIYEGCTQEEADAIIAAPSANDAFRGIWGSKPYHRVG